MKCTHAHVLTAIEFVTAVRAILHVITVESHWEALVIYFAQEFILIAFQFFADVTVTIPVTIDTGAEYKNCK